MTPKKTTVEGEWILDTSRDYVEATVFGEPSKTYVSGLDTSYGTSLEYMPVHRWTPTEGEFNDLHISAPRKGAVPQAIFLDYVKLKGVENITVDLRPGEPPRMTITMFLGKVTYVEDDSTKE
jgi:hypothetical protein